MTIKEFSKELGISAHAVYQRIKAAGIQLDSLKEPGSQELSEDGRKQLAQLFTKQQSTNDDLIKSLQTENEFLKQRCKELEADRDRWQQATEQAQQLAAQEQALSMARLQAPRRSLLDWLSSRNSKP